MTVCADVFMSRDKRAMKRVRIFKERFKIRGEEMCNIHNTFPGICKTSHLGKKNVSIVAKGAYEAVLEKE